VSSALLGRHLDGMALNLLGELTGRLAKESRIISCCKFSSEK